MLVDVHDLPLAVRVGPGRWSSKALEDQDFVEHILGLTRLAQGVYEPKFSFNGRVPIGGLVPDEDHMYPRLDPYLDAYGVADTWDQVLTRYSTVLGAPGRTFVLMCTPVRREDQPVEGGWRWHKWGGYIGTRTPTAEYLRDEPEIEDVVCYHIFEVVLPHPDPVAEPEPETGGAA